jgi:Co/Zn/Cd efflux system component
MKGAFFYDRVSLMSLFCWHRAFMSKAGMELLMAGVSYAVLIGFTISFMFEAGSSLSSSGAEGGGEEVNGYIVLGFALGGLVFDGASLFVFQQYGEREQADLDEEGVAEADTAAAAAVCGINHNMTAALLHVVSDLLRSTTTLVESIVILSVPSIPSDEADGVSALIVCTIIAVGVLGALHRWVLAFYDHLYGPIEAKQPAIRAVSSLDLGGKEAALAPAELVRL